MMRFNHPQLIYSIHSASLHIRPVYIEADQSTDLSEHTFNSYSLTMLYLTIPVFFSNSLCRFSPVIGLVLFAVNK